MQKKKIEEKNDCTLRLHNKRKMNDIHTGYTDVYYNNSNICFTTIHINVYVLL